MSLNTSGCCDGVGDVPIVLVPATTILSSTSPSPQPTDLIDPSPLPPLPPSTGSASSLRVRFRMVTHQSSSSYHQVKARISSNSNLSNQQQQLQHSPARSNSSNMCGEQQQQLCLYDSNQSESLSMQPGSTTSTTTVKTFRLTEDRNIRFDVTLKPTYRIRDNRLNATTTTTPNSATNSRENFNCPSQQQQQQQQSIVTTSLCVRSSSCDQQQRRSNSTREASGCVPNVRLRIRRDGQNLIELPINDQRKVTTTKSASMNSCERAPQQQQLHSESSSTQPLSIPLNSSITFRIRNIGTSTATTGVCVAAPSLLHNSSNPNNENGHNMSRSSLSSNPNNNTSNNLVNSYYRTNEKVLIIFSRPFQAESFFLFYY